MYEREPFTCQFADNVCKLLFFFLLRALTITGVVNVTIYTMLDTKNHLVADSFASVVQLRLVLYVQTEPTYFARGIHTIGDICVQNGLSAFQQRVDRFRFGVILEEREHGELILFNLRFNSVSIGKLHDLVTGHSSGRKQGGLRKLFSEVHL